jgi:uncharacterized membrane protein
MRLELKYGLIGGLAFILWEMGEYLLGFHDIKIQLLPLVSLFSIFVPFVVIFFGILAKRKWNPGAYLTLRDGIKTGLMIALIMALVSAVFFFVYTSYIHPEFIENRTELMRKSLYDKLLAGGQAESPEQARRMAVEQVSKPSPIGAAGYYAMTRTSMGLMLSLLVTLVLKANPPEGFMERLEKEEEEAAEDNS